MLLANVRFTIALSIALRLCLIAFGDWQDQHSPVKYTDIDYYVFTDAARFVSRGKSPYVRDTYRYTPLLAWLLMPTSWSTSWFFFGKLLFAASDVLAGWIIIQTLHNVYKLDWQRATKYANLWLLNPMVAQISTRGSSEGLLLVLVVILLWATTSRRYVLAGCVLGLAVHLKIYPFIYAASIIWWLGESPSKPNLRPTVVESLLGFFNAARIQVAVISLTIFLGLNLWMFWIYGTDFLQHTFFYHLIRSDHRHNFSPYNALLYLNAASAPLSTTGAERYAFIPQLLLSFGLIPFLLAKKDLAATLLAQTFAFVMFNKVCTSQYFLWYMVFLPFYLHNSSLMRNKGVGFTALGLWVAGQALWLQQGFQLEFLGKQTFFPGLFGASIAFFLTNVWILGIIVVDVRRTSRLPASEPMLKAKVT